jgi:hypothetical protein
MDRMKSTNMASGLGKILSSLEAKGPEELTSSPFTPTDTFPPPDPGDVPKLHPCLLIFLPFIHKFQDLMS